MVRFEGCYKMSLRSIVWKDTISRDKCCLKFHRLNNCSGERTIVMDIFHCANILSFIAHEKFGIYDICSGLCKRLLDY